MMAEFIRSSEYFGLLITIMAFCLGIYLNWRIGKAWCNPMLVAQVFVIGVILATGTDYETYNRSAQHVSWVLTPITVCFAVPLYEQLGRLRENYRAILAGIAAGVVTCMASVWGLSKLFGFDKTMFITMLPKSITTPMGIGVAEEFGGYVTLTVCAILVTGLTGYSCGAAACRFFGITEPVAQGVAMGTCAHAIGTVKAIELGRVQGAISGLSIALTGIITVAAVPFFVSWY